MKQPAIVAGIGVLLGVASVAWIRPDSSAGVALVVLVVVTAVSLSGALIAAIRKRS